MIATISTTTLLLLPALFQSAAARPNVERVMKTRGGGGDDDGCPKGAMIIGVRGTLEKPGFGALQVVADALMEKLPDSETLALDYPATGITLDEKGKPIYNIFQYAMSKTQGHQRLTAEISEFVFNCPDTDYVVLGYSQGAHVVGDSLCGVGYGIWQPSPPIDPEFTSNLKAIIQLGDPTNTRDLPWHKGNSTKGGIFPRQAQVFENCKQHSSIWQSWCDANDLFCDRGTSIPIHGSYLERYKDDIVDFVVEKVKQKKIIADGRIHFSTGEEL